MSERITIEKGYGMWHARSTNPAQGEVSGSLEVVLATVAAWLGEYDSDRQQRAVTENLYERCPVRELWPA